MSTSLVKAGKIFFIILIFFAISCNNDCDKLSVKQASEVNDSVKNMTDKIALDVSSKGPVAWLNHFENSPGFFMASDGRLQFPDNDSANRFINHTLVKTIRKIDLKWNNLRIDPLTKTLAGIRSDFHEDIIMSDQKTLSIDGYFTALAEKGPKGWQLRNAHWSIKKPGTM